MSRRTYFIRVELPWAATGEQRERIEASVNGVVETYSWLDGIAVSGGSWVEDEERIDEPIPVALRNLHELTHGGAPSYAEMCGALKRLKRLGMRQVDLQIHLECERAVNGVTRRSEAVESNLLDALDMVTGTVGNPEFRIFQEA